MWPRLVELCERVAPLHLSRPQYRTRGKLAVGPGGVVGLFRRGTYEVAPMAGCRCNHWALERAIEVLEDTLRSCGVKGYDHAANTGDLRHVELTVERISNLVQLVLIWNGADEENVVEDLVEELWKTGIWHSILVHWRDLDPSLQREMRSKRRAAWQQMRPKTRKGLVRATLEETLDDLPFTFGAKSFQQANLEVYEQILKDMKMQLRQLLDTPKPPKLRLLELCGGVGVIGLSLAHVCETYGAVQLLSTDANPESQELFEINAQRLFEKESQVDCSFSSLNMELALRSCGEAEVRN